MRRTSTLTADNSNSWISAFAPATVANVGPGFDCFGFALEGAGDVVSVRLGDQPGVTITSIEGSAADLPRETDRNTAGAAAMSIWRRFSIYAEGRGIELRIEKGLPSGSGLGSSAASAVAAAVATMHLVERELRMPRDDDLVLDACLDGEAVASGQRHADNVAPSLYGGFTIVQPDARRPAVTRLEPPTAWRVATVTPAIEVDTRAAREMLPSHVPLADAVANWSNAAGLVTALLCGNAELARRSLCDRVVEPVRSTLIPGCESVRAAAVAAGALGVGISGSGPTLFAITTDTAIADQVGESMRKAFAELDLRSEVRLSPLGAEGAQLR